METQESRRAGRFVFIDALRGVAALGVLFTHLLHTSALKDTLVRALPHWFQILSGWGAFGVQIFFVLSGFVIAHSLRNSALDRRAVLRFIVRRQLRLDPPYWCALAFVLAIQAIKGVSTLPNAGTVLLNVVYLQRIAHAEEILRVGWTLCMEIQFYLIFILILGSAVKWAKEGQSRFENASVIVGATGLISLIAFFITGPNAWFVSSWFYFASGALCYWAAHRMARPWIFYLFAILFAGAALKHSTLLVGWSAVMAIHAVACAGRLTNLWNNRIIQYFGRISYSLYLVHLPVVLAVFEAGYQLTGQNQRMAVLWLAVSAVLSIAAAHLFYLAVERPSIAFAAAFYKPAKPLTLEPALVPG